MANVTDNKAASRYELVTDGHISIADYRLDGESIYITHVEVPDALRGKGVAALVMAGVVDDATARGLHIVPICSYAATYLARHRL